MSAQEKLIFKQLQKTPDHMYVTPDGSAIYALTDTGMICITSDLDFSTLTEEELNQHIVEVLS